MRFSWQLCTLCVVPVPETILYTSCRNTVQKYVIMCGHINCNNSRRQNGFSYWKRDEEEGKTSKGNFFSFHKINTPWICTSKKCKLLNQQVPPVSDCAIICNSDWRKLLQKGGFLSVDNKSSGCGALLITSISSYYPYLPRALDPSTDSSCLPSDCRLRCNL